MTEQAKVPEIRFAGFTDPWEQRKASEVFQIVDDRGHPTLPVLSATQNQGMIYRDDSGRYIGHDESNEIGYKRVLPGDFVVHLRSFQGGFAHSQYEGITSPAYTVFRAKEPTSHSDRFWKHWFMSEHFIAGLSTVTYGIRDGRSISVDEFMNTFLAFPAVEEQAAISRLFDYLDDLITLHQRKYDKLVVFKKSMLEKMFPKDGESVPEIRFAGFTDPWEQRKLGDVASSFDYGLNAAATEYDGQNKYLRITDIDDETHEFSKSDLTTPLADLAMSADYLLKEGDLLFARTGASVGKTYLYRQFDGMVYFAGFLIRARIGEGADPEFAYQATLTDAYKKYVAITSQRSGQPGVNAQEYADYQLMLPSKTEQQQIGMTLRSLDDLITLHQRKLELLQNIKKSLLDKMFA
ncbi:restriction endonuclease S subunit [Bifidobacterium longum subsp. longum]|uniref:restriction endonuclease subunit S n=1 Tax=Bifidobacterium longum TaxID=216816 RepID=UPI0010E09F20|nr:restriction endonuclease S subunit [Bifidobacterium longum subsp. longum]TCE55183.1 restriction endonuclease S subunit [Bifidobacterium longum subsp. longum]TCE60579.1 restriction endonuclease S subunit [Bifidobacterium longum subsp. longum]